jgi:hypothetical protein
MYFLKLRRKRVTVSSTWLWTRSVQDLRVNAPFQRLRRNLLLLLQLLLIVLASLALARPAGQETRRGGKTLIMMLDRSASMAAKDVSPSRLGEAKRLARGHIEALGGDDQVMIIAFDTRAEVVQPLTSEKPRALAALERVQATDSPTRIREAFIMAATTASKLPQSSVVLLSDGRFEPIPDPTHALNIPVTFIPVGQAGRNAAISSLEVQPPTRPDDPWTVFVQIDLYANQAEEVSLELHVDGQLKAVRNVKAQPQKVNVTLFELERRAPRTVEVKLTQDDDLAVDNRAWAVVSDRKMKVLLVTPGNFFLEQVLAQSQDVELFRTTPEAGKIVSPEDYDVVVFDQAPVPDPPQGRLLLIQSLPHWPGLEVQGTMENPTVVDWDHRHPENRHILHSGLTVRSTPKLKLPPEGAPLVEANQGPLIFTLERGPTRVLGVTFNLLDSDWPLRPSFPLFMSHAVSWLAAARPSQRRGSLSPGDPLTIPLRRDERSIEIEAPDGKRSTLEGAEGSEVTFSATGRTGLYTLRRSKNPEWMAVNLFNPQESNIAVVRELRVGESTIEAAAADIPSPREWWRPLAWAVLGFLLLEWFAYHRRLEFP